jgi:hypothetical protein
LAVSAGFRALHHDDVSADGDGFTRVRHALDLADEFGAGLMRPAKGLGEPNDSMTAAGARASTRSSSYGRLAMTR